MLWVAFEDDERTPRYIPFCWRNEHALGDGERDGGNEQQEPPPTPQPPEIGPQIHPPNTLLVATVPREWCAAGFSHRATPTSSPHSTGRGESSRRTTGRSARSPATNRSDRASPGAAASATPHTARPREAGAGVAR